MNQRTRRRWRREEAGFTLIELLIVIVILGILSAVVVFAVTGISDRGSNAACRSDYKNVEVAQEAHKAQKGVYAANVQALVDAQLLRDAPASSEYTITTDSSGTVTVTGPEAGTNGRCKSAGSA
jgi:prepilin-type N-terminal cleavage/methylation domain-containing protein